MEMFITARSGFFTRTLRPGRLTGLAHMDISDLHKFHFVLRYLVLTQLKVRYQRSALDFFCTLLNQIFMQAVAEKFHRPMKWRCK